MKIRRTAVSLGFPSNSSAAKKKHGMAQERYRPALRSQEKVMEVGENVSDKRRIVCKQTTNLRKKRRVQNLIVRQPKNSQHTGK